MSLESRTPAGGSAADGWKGLRLFNLYRAVVAGLFLVVAFLGGAPAGIGETHPVAFAAGAGLWFLFAIGFGFGIDRRWLAFGAQVHLHALADILFISVLSHASGGLSSGIGMLLVTSVAFASLLQTGRRALFHAAVATIALLLETGWSWLNEIGGATEFSHAGMLGAALFATALLAHVLHHRLQASEALAEERGARLDDLAALNARIVEQVDTGVVAIDREGRIVATNSLARQLLDLGPLPAAVALRRVAPPLAEALGRWRVEGGRDFSLPRPSSPNTLDLRFAPLEESADGAVLAFLQDSSERLERIQDEKLRAMGRLTGSIAHEVRNPVGAIGHAAQLLQESPSLGEEEQKFVAIIRRNVERLDGLVDSTLALSRRKLPRGEVVPLAGFLEDFRRESLFGSGLPEDALRVRVTPPDLQVTVDPEHLHQVLSILRDNALENASDLRDSHLRLHASRPGGDGAVLEVIDNGRGVDPAVADKIFEPFFTTRGAGTGLGLFIARELCQANRCEIDYRPVPAGGACFQIRFPAPAPVETQGTAEP